jgi:hypothetical protein
MMVVRLVQPGSQGGGGTIIDDGQRMVVAYVK